ncbi:hypothetical protein GGI13_002350 [Coemansia sp. RSA 455]|nr:hypothetical protein GGI13_002350 [Coemansia sp. RSA 455]
MDDAVAFFTEFALARHVDIAFFADLLTKFYHVKFPSETYVPFFDNQWCYRQLQRRGIYDIAVLFKFEVMATVEQQISSKAQEGIRTTHNDHILMLQEEYTRRHFPGHCKPFWSKEILDDLQAQHHEQCQAKEILEEQQRPAKEARKVKRCYHAVVRELKQRGQRLAREERRLAKEARKLARRLAREERSRNPPTFTSARAIHRAYRKSVHAARNITC